MPEIKKYFSRNQNWKKPKSPYMMDRKSERYRICPNCGLEFMTEHLNRIYCVDKCADEFHNRKKRETEKSGVDMNGKLMQKEAEPDIETTAILRQNIEILDTLTLDNQKGSLFHFDYLTSLGLNLNYYAGRGQLFNIDQQLGCHFIQIGLYRLYRMDYSEFLIFKQDKKIIR